MLEYLEIARNVLENGSIKEDRTGTGTISLPSSRFEYDMSTGKFPLLTTKRMATKSIKVELEGFLNGITDKKWFQDRGCRIWDEWCNPEKVPYSNDNEEIKEMMKEERDLGPIYGYQWRHWNAPYGGHEEDYTGKGIDQLANMVKSLKEKPDDRRMVVEAWNPEQIPQMALPPCHYSFQTTVSDGKLNLRWDQRSVDVPLGLPFNVASYGIALHLLALETGYKPGILTGNFGDTHIYKNQIEGIEEQLSREPRELPTIRTKGFTSIFEWDHTQTKFKGYNPHPKIEFPIAV